MSKERPSAEKDGEFSVNRPEIQRSGTTVPPVGIGMGRRYSVWVRTALTNASMLPRFAQAILLHRSPNGSGLAAPPRDGARYGRAVSCRLLRPIRISSSAAGETSKDENESSPLNATGSHFPSGSE